MTKRLMKRFYITEQMFFQMKGSAQNLMNHANFDRSTVQFGWGSQSWLRPGFQPALAGLTK